MVQVVNYERRDRLRPPPITTIPFNLNTISIVIIVLVLAGLYKRYADIKRSRERYGT